jgi:C_GCAxxG_C_C family probable redox protein
MNRVELAVSCFEGGCTCSQALLLAYGVKFGLDRDIALRIADGFGGGMGNMGETCGVVTGAFMVIGLKHGRTVLEDRDAHRKTNSLINDFVSLFKSRNGSIVCKELLCCDVSTPEGLNSAREKKLLTTVCPKYVRDAAEIVEELLRL